MIDVGTQLVRASFYLGGSSARRLFDDSEGSSRNIKCPKAVTPCQHQPPAPPKGGKNEVRSAKNLSLDCF
eukprot:6173910-Pleurochrysis_carterae.AAC.5